MSNNEEQKVEVPQEEKAFTELLEKFGVGTKTLKPETIAENISRTGGEYVFEDPQRLAERLSTWHEYVSPVKRKQILEQWFAEKGIEVPEEAIKLAGIKSSEIRAKEDIEKRKGEEEEKRKAKFFVDTETGMIRAAKEGERALTWDEAERVADRIKKDLKLKKTEAMEEGKETKEPAFVIGEAGEWTLNPKGEIGFGEFAVFQMYQDSLKKGEPIDPIEELARREEASSRLKEAMGFRGEDTEMTILDKLQKLGMLQTGGGNLTDVLSQLDTIGLLRKPGDEGRGTELDMLDKLNTLGMLAKPGEAEGVAGQTIRALEGEVKELRESLQKQEMDALKNIVVSLSNQIGDMRKEIATGGRLEGRYALMDKTIGAIDSQLSGLRSDAKPLLEMVAGGGAPEPRKKSSEDRAKIAKGVKEAVALEREARDLEDELLFRGKTS